MDLGLSSVDWQNYTQDYVDRKTRMYRSAYSNPNYGGYNTSTNPVDNTHYAVSATTGNTCTDGKENGEIGVPAVLYHVGKGAVNGIVNGVKGCFLNDKGEIDPLKTLGTVAMGAACVAFPAVGLVACGIGAVTGGVKLASGVATALNAKTDAEAKDAWEQVGDGGLTTAMSVAGAKASYGAIKSTAGAASELANLSKDATLLEKAGALAKDMVSSTKNQAKDITFGIRSKFAQKEAAKEVAEAGKGFDKASMEMASFEEKISDGQISSLKDAIKETGLTEEQLKQNPEIWNQIPGVDKIEVAKTGILGKAKAKISELEVKLPEVKLQNIAKNLNKFRKKPDFANTVSNLSERGKAIIEFLTTEEGTYAEAVQNFGYDNVAQALSVFASYKMLDETV